MDKKILLKLSINLIFIAFFVFILTEVEFNMFMEISSKINVLIWSEIGFLFSFLYFLKSFRIKVLNNKFSLGKTYLITAYHNFFLMLLPLKLGELAYIKKLKEERIGLSKSISDIILFRTYDILVIILFCIFFLAGSRILGDYYIILIILFVLALAFITYPILFSNLIPSFSRIAFLNRVSQILKKIIGANKISLTKKIILLLITLLIWLTSLSIWVILLNKIIEISLTQAFLASLISTLTTFLPLNPPANIGITQGGWLLGFYLLKLPLDVGLAFSIFANVVYIISITLIFLMAKLIKFVIDNLKLGIYLPLNK